MLKELTVTQAVRGKRGGKGRREEGKLTESAEENRTERMLEVDILHEVLCRSLQDARR